ncbi:swr1 complex component [Tilletia horrida]|uniref:DNA helicase n=1 Tax=Tilletia horrida TaxID=155126 RepID=A0AAN6GS03_9BASI|nr:swr1 complex component [Tilletia horrida]KAK0553330.1 swr1 complex component [Tilletia horrida]KAK0567715.1 swr1 complex component [Tilletia horrida]
MSSGSYPPARRRAFPTTSSSSSSSLSPYDSGSGSNASKRRRTTITASTSLGKLSTSSSSSLTPISSDYVVPPSDESEAEDYAAFQSSQSRHASTSPFKHIVVQESDQEDEDGVEDDREGAGQISTESELDIEQSARAVGQFISGARAVGAMVRAATRQAHDAQDQEEDPGADADVESGPLGQDGGETYSRLHLSTPTSKRMQRDDAGANSPSLAQLVTPSFRRPAGDQSSNASPLTPLGITLALTQRRAAAERAALDVPQSQNDLVIAGTPEEDDILEQLDVALMDASSAVNQQFGAGTEAAPTNLPAWQPSKEMEELVGMGEDVAMDGEEAADVEALLSTSRSASVAAAADPKSLQESTSTPAPGLTAEAQSSSAATAAGTDNKTDPPMSPSDPTQVLIGPPKPKKRKRPPASEADALNGLPPPDLTGDFIARSWSTRSNTLRSFFGSFAFDEQGQPINRRKFQHEIREASRHRIELDMLAAEGFHLDEGWNVEGLQARADLAWLRIERDHQAHLVGAALEVSEELRDRRKLRMATTSKIAKMVKLYWVRKADLEEKRVRAVERARKNLARWTGREVMKQWKLAADLVGGQLDEAERREHEREGRKQLKAILEQSSQLLSHQRSDLFGAEDEEEISDSEQEEEEELDDDDEEEEDDTDEDESQEEEDEDEEEAVEEKGAEEEGLDAEQGQAESRVDDDLNISDSEEEEIARPLWIQSRRSHMVSASEDEDEDLISDSGASLVEDPAESVVADSEEERVREQAGKNTGPVAATVQEPNPTSAEDAPSENTRERRPTVTIAEQATVVEADDDELSLIDDSGASLAESLLEEDSDSGTDQDVEMEDDSDGSSITSSSPQDDGGDADPVLIIGAEGSKKSEKLEIAIEEDTSKRWARFLVVDNVKGMPPAPAVLNPSPPHIVEIDEPVENTAPLTLALSPDSEGDDERSFGDDSSSVDIDLSTLANSSPGPAEQDRRRRGRSSASVTPLHDVVVRKNASGRRSQSRSTSVVSSVKGTEGEDGDGQNADKPKVRIPFLLRGVLRPYQHVGLDWLASLYNRKVNGILADEMGLGKTIQTIAVLAHLACEHGNWGPHLVVAPTSVMLNWEVEFKKFLPGFKILTYYGTQKERKEKRVGWMQENAFNVCITSYQLTLADAHILRRRSWQYLILDEAHHIKNFRSQRWQTLLGFKSRHRLLLTGTPLQNNLMDLWSLMYFLKPQGLSESMEQYSAFASLKDFQDWFSNPLDKAIEAGGPMSEETKQMVTTLHTLLRPYILRRLKKDVEKQLPSKHEHVITCRLSKRQRFLYNDFMSRAKTKESLASGSYMSIINCLMQLRKVCNHPDLFEERPILTSFAMDRSVAADFEIKELLIRRRFLQQDQRGGVDLGVLNGDVTTREHLSAISTRSISKLAATKRLPYYKTKIPPPLPVDTWSIEVFPKVQARTRLIASMQRWKHFANLNALRCARQPIYGAGVIEKVQRLGVRSPLPLDVVEQNRRRFWRRSDKVHEVVQSNVGRKLALDPILDRFTFVTPAVTAADMPRWALPGLEPSEHAELQDPDFDTLHSVATKQHIAFPETSLLQYDCGKLQQLDLLMRRLKQGGHRILIFTQMTKMLDILESFLNYHGYRYLRLDGATKVDQRQLLTERFNRDARIDAFILSTRSGGLGINLVGADTVLFYDLDWNAAIEAQCMDRAHRIGQTRDVHIYRFVSEHTVEENMLRKANQKRQLNTVVIQEGEFTTDTLIRNDWRDMFDEGGQTIAGVPVGRAAETLGAEADRHLKAVEDEEDVQAAAAVEEEVQLDRPDYEVMGQPAAGEGEDEANEGGEDGEEEEASLDRYMINFVKHEWDYFELLYRK